MPGAFLVKVVVGLLTIHAGVFWISSNGHCQGSDTEFVSSVVEICTQDKKVIGTGTSISFSGLIMTAKHVLVDGSEAGGHSPNYLLKVFVRRRMGAQYEVAELLTIHPFMDIAILVSRSAEAIPPMKICRLKDVAAGGEITLIGHRQVGNELYETKRTKIDEIDRHGHVIAGRMVAKGSSGGPAICGKRLIGVIRSTGADKTVIVPIEGALDYFKLRGVKFSEDGEAAESDDIAKLAGKVELYEQILSDIQMDVNWMVRMNPIRNGSSLGGPLPDDMTLVIWYQQKLTAQPDFNTSIKIRAVPIFENPSFQSIARQKRHRFERTDWLVSQDQRFAKVVFDKFGMDIRALLERDYGPKGIIASEFRGFDILARIGSISGTGFIKRPEDQTICFKLRLDKTNYEFNHPIEAVGTRCTAGDF